MPKKIVKTKSKASPGKNGSKILLVIIFLVILCLGIGGFLLKDKILTVIPFLGPAPVKALAVDIGKGRQLTVDSKGGTVHLYDSRKILISVNIPANAVSEKHVFIVSPVKSDNVTQTGVTISPEGYKFRKPITISFDFSKSDVKNNAPDMLKNAKVRETGSTHVYSYNKTNNELIPALVARGTETATYLPTRTLFTGAYYVRINDRDQISIARKTVDNANSYFYSVLEAATTLVFNNQSLTTEEKASVKTAIDKVIKKSNTPLFELYAALLLKKKVEVARASFVSQAYAEDSLYNQLEKTCHETNHTLETYIVAALLADISAISDVADGCRSTLESVVPEKVKALVADPNVSFEAVVTMLSQVQAIEGEGSPLVSQLQEKLQKVVERDVAAAANGNGSPASRQQASVEMDFANVDPSLKAKLEAVQANDAKRQLDNLLAQECPMQEDLKWGKVTATQFHLDSYVAKLDQLIAKNMDCRDVSGGDKKDGNPPPPPKDPNNPAPTQAAGECLYIDDYEISGGGGGGESEFSCKYCYEVYRSADVNDGTILRSDCEVGTGYDYCMALQNGLDQQSCDYSQYLPGGPMNPDGNSGDDQSDPPIADPKDYQNNDKNSSNDDPPIADPKDYQNNNDNGNNGGDNNLDIGLDE